MLHEGLCRLKERKCSILEDHMATNQAASVDIWLEEEGVGAGKHCCGLFSSKEEHDTVTLKFFLDGVNNNEQICFCPDTKQQEIVSMFAQRNIDIIPYIEKQQIIFAKSPCSFVEEGIFNSLKFINMLQHATDNAIAMGFSRFRWTSDGGWLDDKVRSNWQQCEASLVDFVATNPCVTLCEFDTRAVDSNTLLSVISLHPQLMMGVEEYDNLYFTGQPTLDCKEPQSTLNKWIKNIKQQKEMEKEMEKELEKTNESLKRVRDELCQETAKKRQIEFEMKSAQQALQSQSEYIAVVSHELRTPLNGIVCMNEILLQSGTANPETTEDIALLDSSSKQLMATLNSVLDFSKLEAGKVMLEERLLSVEAIVKDVVSTFAARGSECPLITTNIDTSLPTNILGDSVRLRQILMNLLSNAVDATQPRHDGETERTIQINVTGKQSTESPQTDRFVELLVSVKDNGPGIPIELQENLFQSYTRRLRGKSCGLGIGLSIVQKLVELMNGKVWFETQQGLGSTFYISVKLKLDDFPLQTIKLERQMCNTPPGRLTARTLSPAQHQQQSSSPYLPLKILLAEDNPVNQRAMKHVMHKLNYDVKIVSSGKEAVKEASQRDYNVILMDLWMPDMNGMDATSAIIQNCNNLQKVRPVIVAMTGSTDEREQCEKIGMDYFITKPIVVQDLIRVFNKIKSTIVCQGDQSNEILRNEGKP